MYPQRGSDISPGDISEQDRSLHLADAFHWKVSATSRETNSHARRKDALDPCRGLSNVVRGVDMLLRESDAPAVVSVIEFPPVLRL